MSKLNSVEKDRFAGEKYKTRKTLKLKHSYSYFLISIFTLAQTNADYIAQP